MVSTPQARFFCSHIFKFNSQFAMASSMIDHDSTVSNQLGGAVAFQIMDSSIGKLVLYIEIKEIHSNIFL